MITLNRHNLTSSIAPINLNFGFRTVWHNQQHKRSNHIEEYELYLWFSVFAYASMTVCCCVKRHCSKQWPLANSKKHGLSIYQRQFDSDTILPNRILEPSSSLSKINPSPIRHRVIGLTCQCWSRWPPDIRTDMDILTEGTCHLKAKAND